MQAEICLSPQVLQFLTINVAIVESGLFGKSIIKCSMNAMNSTVVERAVASKGGSSEAIYRMVSRVLTRRHTGGGTLLDVGCGSGELRAYVAPFISEYIGADVIRYNGFPADATYLQIDLDAGRVPLLDASAEVVVAVETIEHLENPRAFFRELYRLTKPGGLILVTTPNQLTLTSLLTLIIKREFNAFQKAPGLYPAHITALLEIDLLRIAHENSLQDAEIDYSDSGRMPFTARQWPATIFGGRLFRDNVLLAAVRPVA